MIDEMRRIPDEFVDPSGSTTTEYIRDPDGTVLAIHNPAGGNGGDYYPLFDGLGSTTNLTDANGNVVDTFTYTPYGQATTTGSVTDPIQYAGGYDDNASGNENLTKFGQRYLDPSTGRWTQIDPINNPLDQHGWNQYNYAGDDPINFLDPSGLSLCSSIFGHHVCGVIHHAAKIALGAGLVAAGGVAIAGAVGLEFVCTAAEGPLGTAECIPAALGIGAIGASSIYLGAHEIRTS